MDSTLVEIVIDRLGQHQLDTEPADLLLAALIGDEDLARQLNAAPGERYFVPKPEVSAQSPVGAYLSSVTVRGFRGIGPAATLPLKEGPGLTLVVGRNGSGKSSFAEGLEVLLTSNLMRLNKAPVAAKDGWRCKHAAGDAEVIAEFYVEGKGKTTVGRRWLEAATDMAQSDAWVQVNGQKQAPLATLGWDTDLVEYRPFLSHAELEAFFGGPSELHDLLANVLGLEDLTSADKRLQGAVKLREDKLSAAKRDLEQLRPRLAALADDDERAHTAKEALTGTNPGRWDIDAALAVATGSHQEASQDGQIARLRRLTSLSAPPADDVSTEAGALREAVGGLTLIKGSAAEQARDLAALLDAALRHHHGRGDGPCPVCGMPDALTPAWHAEAELQRDRLQQAAQEADEASTQAKSALTTAMDLIQALPQPLATVITDDPAATGDAAEAWKRWAAIRENAPAPTVEGLTALADHLESTHAALAEAVTTLAAEAATELTKRDDQWTPLAADLASWCEIAATARDEAGPVPALKEARKWLTQATAEIREQRLTPLADQSRDIWADLRQESNVSLGAFRLTGTNTRRRLDLDVTIDGAPGSALGVMSQGEINALALSIFLPRATIAASPFRFLLIDDPVQAMDPAKVDGLAKVLDKVAKHRQVIVFTHDNRLVSAVKDLSVPATILEVTRQPGSAVTVRPCLDAVDQALKDATSLGKDPNIPRNVAERVIPGLCRTAAEAAFVQAYWRRQLRDGATRAAIEAALDGNGKKLNLRAAAALALFGSQAEAGKVTDHLTRHWGAAHAGTYRALNKGAHEGHSGPLANLVEDAKALVSAITAKLP